MGVGRLRPTGSTFRSDGMTFGFITFPNIDMLARRSRNVGSSRRIYAVQRVHLLRRSRHVAAASAHPPLVEAAPRSATATTQVAMTDKFFTLLA